jgi:CheY-like chemotaxis protein
MALTAQPRSVLVIDDDLDSRTLLGEFLHLLGCNVELAADGVEALQHLRDPDRRPCLILLDMMMPVMGGWEFRREQARDPNLSDIPVVMVSAAVEDLNREAHSVRIHDALRKPVSFDQLCSIVDRYCP